jgi:hypothetical protein
MMGGDCSVVMVSLVAMRGGNCSIRKDDELAGWLVDE